MLALVLSFGQLLEVASKLLTKLTCIVESSAKHELLAEPDQQSIANLETKKVAGLERPPVYAGRTMVKSYL